MRANESTFNAQISQQALEIERCARQAYELERPFFPARQPPWSQQTLEIQKAYRDVAGVVRVALLRVLAIEQLAALRTKEKANV